jgi:predicted ATP-grasp superfamily ATP-dependent carboligase
VTFVMAGRSPSPGCARVLVTGGEFPAGLALLRAVRAGGDEPIAVIDAPYALARSSRAAHAVERAPSASSDPDGFLTAIGRVAERHRAAAVLPGTEPSLRVLAGNADRFSQALLIGCPAPAIVERVLSKASLREIAAAGGIRTPPTRELAAGQAEAWDHGFPAVVKPISSHVPLRDSCMARGVVRSVGDGAELAAALEALPGRRGLVQPYLTGGQRTVDGLAWEGNVVAIAQKVGDRTWPRDCGVLSHGRIVASDPELDARCRAMMAECGWSGLFNLQFLDTPQGRFVIDFNPRAWNSLAVQIEAGANMPAAWVDLLLGRPVRPAVPHHSRWFRSEIDDALSLRAAWRAGMRKEAVRGMLPRRHTSHAIWSWRDPWPAFRVLRQGGRRGRGLRHAVRAARR